MRHRQIKLRRRYGRIVYGRSDAGRREVEHLLREQDAPTRRAPRLTMKEEIAWEKRLRAIREAEKER